MEEITLIPVVLAFTAFFYVVDALASYFLAWQKRPVARLIYTVAFNLGPACIAMVVCHINLAFYTWHWDVREVLLNAGFICLLWAMAIIHAHRVVHIKYHIRRADNCDDSDNVFAKHLCIGLTITYVPYTRRPSKLKPTKEQEEKA